MRAQDEPEGEEADVVLLAGCAGQQGEGSRTAAPEPRQREQPASDQVAGEMLLADLDAALLPTAPDGAQCGEDEIAYEGLEPEGGQPVIQRGLNGGFVVRLDRAHQTRPLASSIRPSGEGALSSATRAASRRG